MAIAILAMSGVLSKSNAQEKLFFTDTSVAKKDFLCNPTIQARLVLHQQNCETQMSSQKDSVAKGIKRDSHEIAYATEPTQFVPIRNIVSPTTSPTIVIVPTIVPDPTQQAPLHNFSATQPQNLNADLILELINAHRAKIGKTAFQKDGALCSLAQTRSTELYDELFVKGGLHSGLYNRNLPYWVTENAKYGSNEAGTVQWWLNSPIHRSAIEGDSVYSCGACQGTQCSQLFTSYTPKYNAALPKTATTQ